MLTLIRNGGIVSMLFILATGLATLLAAFHFAVRARKQSLGFIKGMATATLFGTLAATCADVGATLYAADRAFEDHTQGAPPDAKGPPPASAHEAEALPNALHIVISGCAESTSPGILGFSFLALTGMLVAVGRRRLDERETS